MRKRQRLTPKEIQREDWIIYTIAAVVTAIIALALFGYFSGMWESNPAPAP